MHRTAIVKLITAKQVKRPTLMSSTVNVCSIQMLVIFSNNSAKVIILRHPARTDPPAHSPNNPDAMKCNIENADMSPVSLLVL